MNVSLRDRNYNRLRHRTFHGEVVPGVKMIFPKIPQLSVMSQKIPTHVRDEMLREPTVNMNEVFESRVGKE